jgi:lipid II:glycine glycyltransferase (peptidoglycan interpeptide bridge formation enzyme)
VNYPKIQVLENLDPNSPLGQEWEQLVKTNAASGIMQSLYWAQAKKEQGLDTIHLVISEADILLAGALFYKTKKLNGTNILFAPEGPVIPWADQKLAGKFLAMLVDHIQSMNDQTPVMALRIEPRLVGPLPACLREFSRAPVDLVPRETLYIDLSLSENSLLAQMKEKGRYNIKLAQRNGINVTEDNIPNAVDRFYSIMQEASLRDDFALEPKSHFQSLADNLIHSGHLKFLFAEHENETLGTLLLISYGERATYLYGGISDLKRNLMGGYTLQWRAMQLAKHSGCKIYDFYGYDRFRSPDHRYARFSQFKSQFGGTPITLIGAQEYFYLDCLADVFVKVVQESNQMNIANPNLVNA